MEKSIVSLRVCEDYKDENLNSCLKKVFEDLGGLDKYVKPGMTVLLKVNLLAKCNPNQAVTTHPALVEAVAKKVIDLGAKCIIGDSPASRFNEKNVNAIYDTTGMKIASHNSKAGLNQNFESFKANINGERLKESELIDVLNKVDIVINMPKMKTHGLTGYSGCVKNLYGTIPGLIKAQTHSLFPKLVDFCNALLDINEYLKDKVVLHIVDAVVAMEGAGPQSGTPRIVNRIIAGENPYAVDSVIVKLMNQDPAHSPLLAEATRRKLIDNNFSIDLKGETIENSAVPDFKSVFVSAESTASPIPKGLRKIFKKFFQRRPIIDPKMCKGCGKCAEHCPMNAIRMEYDKKGGMFAKIDYNKCINCFCCQELCPFHVVKIKTPWGYKMIQKKQIKRDKKTKIEKKVK